MVKGATEEEILEGVYKRALSSSDGDEVKADLMYFVHRPSFHDSAFVTAHREGERALAIRILQLCGELS